MTLSTSNERKNKLEFDKTKHFSLGCNWHVILISGVQHIHDMYALWNNHHSKSSLHPPPHINILSLVIRIFKIYSLSNFQVYNIVLVTAVSSLYIIYLNLFVWLLEVCVLWPLSPISFKISCTSNSLIQIISPPSLSY